MCQVRRVDEKVEAEAQVKWKRVGGWKGSYVDFVVTKIVLRRLLDSDSLHPKPRESAFHDLPFSQSQEPFRLSNLMAVRTFAMRSPASIIFDQQMPAPVETARNCASPPDFAILSAWTSLCLCALSVEVQKLCGRKNPHTLPCRRRKVFQVAGNETFGTPGQSDFEERFILLVRQTNG